MRHIRQAVLFLAVFCAPLLSGGCAAGIARYRDPQRIQSYHYALGEQYAEVNGLRICYQEFGSGPTVVIIPGLATSVDFWQRNIPALAEQFHVIALDPPGFGKSDKPDVGYDLPWLTDQINEFLEQRGVQRFSVIGGSLGGHLGLLLALNYPARVEKVVMMGSTGGWPEPDILTRIILALWSEQAVSDYTRYNWPKFYGMMFKHRSPMSDAIFRYQMALRAGGDTYDAEGRAIGRALRSIFLNSCRSRLASLDKPVLLIWGAEDHIHPPVCGVDLRERMPDSRLVIVPNSAHEVMVDQAGEFNRLVSNFLSGGTAVVSDRPPRGAPNRIATDDQGAASDVRASGG